MSLCLFALALACAVAVCAAQTAHARARSGLDAAERSLIDAINRMRAGHGLRPLRVSPASTSADRILRLYRVRGRSDSRRRLRVAQPDVDAASAI